MKGFMQIATSKLIKAGWNYKIDNSKMLEKLTQNIKKNGQIENIIVREIEDGNYEVVNGNHRLEALVNLGIDKVYCFNLGDISIEQAKRIAIETNETRFDADQFSLSEILKELVDTYNIEEIEITMPFTTGEIEDLLKITEFSLPEEDNPLDGEPKEKEPKVNVCPNCGHTWEQ
jgi:ParB family transcriptional regulator, chromosome partitioning protein